MSVNPPTLKATTGVPHACDSIPVPGKLSFREGNTNKSLAL